MRLIALCGITLLASACTGAPTDETLPAPPPAGGVCNAEPAKVLVGERASSDTGARALYLSGAARLRWGPPDSAWTMDYRQDRVNVRYDRAMSIIEVTCG